MILAIDIGNTRTKVGLFFQEELQDVYILPTDHLAQELEARLRSLDPNSELLIGWTSVSHETSLSTWEMWKRFSVPPQFIEINRQTPLPIGNAYATPETLGIDRIVGVIGARSIRTEGPILLIDAGTALTFEYLDRDNVYQGGAISPGIRMRFQALHQLTAKLPLIETSDSISLVGDSTQTCIQSGVMYGILAEVEGIIRAYRSHAGEDLSVFLTGGDMSHFEKLGKNINFADPNLILRGIHVILTLNYRNE